MRCAATIFVKRLEPMASFYEACFGLKDVGGARSDYRVLESTRREGTPIKLSFDVPSIAAAQARIADLGGQVDDLEWEFRGYRHRDLMDPEGNVNQVREAATG